MATVINYVTIISWLSLNHLSYRLTVGRFIRWYLRRPICLSACHVSSWFQLTHAKDSYRPCMLSPEWMGIIDLLMIWRTTLALILLLSELLLVSILRQTSDTATLLLFSARCRGLSTEINQDYFTESDNDSPTDYNPSFISILQHNLLSFPDLQLNFLSE